MGKPCFDFKQVAEARLDNQELARCNGLASQGGHSCEWVCRLLPGQWGSRTQPGVAFKILGWQE